MNGSVEAPGGAASSPWHDRFVFGRSPFVMRGISKQGKESLVSTLGANGGGMAARTSPKARP